MVALRTEGVRECIVVVALVLQAERQLRRRTVDQVAGDAQLGAEYGLAQVAIEARRQQSVVDVELLAPERELEAVVPRGAEADALETEVVEHGERAAGDEVEARLGGQSREHRPRHQSAAGCAFDADQSAGGRQSAFVGCTRRAGEGDERGEADNGLAQHRGGVENAGMGRQIERRRVNAMCNGGSTVR